MLPRLALTIAAAILTLTSQVAAQAPASAQPSPPAYVAVTDGVALIERDGRVESNTLNMPIVPGDRLRTTEGRMQVRFADGTALALDVRTVVDVESETLLRLMDGRIRMMLRSTVPWRIDSPGGSARLVESGEYRLALVAGPRQAEGDVQLEFAVARGSGDIFTDHGKTTVHAGERAYASTDLLPSEPYPFNSAGTDDFDGWPAAPAALSSESSSQYLPSDLQTYSPTFDAYGDWLYLPAYGHVWCPHVTLEWRPYAFGRWMTYPRYGLTWVGSEPFAWPTHHYGRWGTVAGRWFWMPSSNWSPAHVAWSSSGDSVSWAPLGPRNRAVQASSSRTVVSRADFDRHTIVPEAGPIERTRSVPAGSTRGVPAPPTPAPATPAPATTAARWMHQPRAVVPVRTIPVLNPVPRSQARPAASVAPPSTAPAQSANPSAAPAPAAPASAPTRAWQTQPAPAHGAAPPSKAAPAQPAQPSGQPATTGTAGRGQAPATREPARPAARGGRGGV